MTALDRLVFTLRATLWLSLSLTVFYFCVRAGFSWADIPADAARWKHEAVRQWRAEWGLDAPTSALAAQVGQESTWRADARSPVGAAGLTQFMPATAKWLAGAYSALGPADPMNPVWALRAQAKYDRYLFDRQTGYDDCERGAKMLSAYNGGESRVKKDEALCASSSRPCKPAFWFGNVELIQDERAPSAWLENRNYPAKILLRGEPEYVAAEWGLGLCS